MIWVSSLIQKRTIILIHSIQPTFLRHILVSIILKNCCLMFFFKPKILPDMVTQVYISGVALNAAAVNLLMLILGRILLGCGVGFANQVALGFISIRCF